jgi:hypothetical protein
MLLVARKQKSEISGPVQNVEKLLRSTLSAFGSGHFFNFFVFRHFNSDCMVFTQLPI